MFHNLIETLIAEREHFNRIWFAADQLTPPPFSYQVNFPRLELVISGEYENELEDPEQVYPQSRYYRVMRCTFLRTAGTNQIGKGTAQY